MNKLVKKFKNRIGTTLVELLATVVLLGIMGVALTTGIHAIQNTYNKIVRKANEQTLLSTTLIEMRNEIRHSVDYDDKTGRFQSKDGYWFAFYNGDGADNKKGIIIKYYPTKSTPDGNDTPFKAVVSDKDGDISKVYSTFTEIKDEGNGVFGIYGLAVGEVGSTNKTVLFDDENKGYMVTQTVYRNGGSE